MSEKHALAWQDYEGAVLEHLRQEFAGTAVRVLGTDGRTRHTVIGRYSKVPRQLDVAAYGLGDARPFFIADAKMQAGRLDVKEVESFIGMAEDVGAKVAALLAPEGFTPGAERRAQAAAMHLEVLTIEQALTWHWLPLARDLYPYDWIFRRELAHALRLLKEEAPADSLVLALEGVAYDEWIRLIAYALAEHPSAARRFLEAVAEAHPDDGWRFNAVQRLLEIGAIDEGFRTRLLRREKDLETRDLLLGRYG